MLLPYDIRKKTKKVRGTYLTKHIKNYRRPCQLLTVVVESASNVLEKVLDVVVMCPLKTVMPQ